MPQILRTIPSYFPHVTGPANQARAISQSLRPLGYESSILTTTFGATGAPTEQILDGIKILRAPTRIGVMQYHVAPKAWRIFRSQSYDLLHVHSYRNFLADAAALTKLRRDTPLVLHLHGSLVGYRAIAPKSRWWLYKAYDLVSQPLGLLRHARIVVSTTAEAIETQQYGIAPDRISVIPMGINIADYSFDVQRDPTTILFVGRLTEDRNPELLIRALALIRDLPWSCNIVGAEVRRSFATSLGYTDSLKQLAYALGISERITFTGQLYAEQLRHMYARAGIFVYPSHYENFGQTMLEAAAAGCVLITTPVGVAHDLVRDDVTGFRITSADPASLAQQIQRLLELPALQQTMSARVQHIVRRQFAWEPIVQRYVSLYDDVIADHAQQKTRFWPGAQRSQRGDERG